MTSVSFYKVAGDQQVALALACQLIQKAHQLQQQVLCLVADQQTAEILDQKLWTFQPEAFVPHAQGAEQKPVAISHRSDDPGDHHDILINLTADIPVWFSRFQRVLEVISGDDSQQKAKRACFRFYKERGYPLSFHDLTDKFAP